MIGGPNVVLVFYLIAQPSMTFAAWGQQRKAFEQFQQNVM